MSKTVLVERQSFQSAEIEMNGMLERLSEAIPLSGLYLLILHEFPSDTRVRLIGEQKELYAQLTCWDRFGRLDRYSYMDIGLVDGDKSYGFHSKEDATPENIAKILEALMA